MNTQVRKHVVKIIAETAKSQFDLGGSINDHIWASIAEFERSMRRPCARPDVAELIIEQVRAKLTAMGYSW
jgi:hypothetical protein